MTPGYQNTFRNITENFKNTFYLYCIGEWNRLDAEITKNQETFSNFKGWIMRFIKVDKLSIHDTIGIKTVKNISSGLKLIK